MAGLTPAEEAELAALEAQQPQSRLTPAEEAELAALEAEANPSLGTRALNVGKTALDVGLRTAAVPGGLVRAGLFGAGDIGRQLGGQEPVVTPEDVIQASQGAGPSFAKYLERSGYPAGPSLNDLPDNTVGNLIRGVTQPFINPDTSVRDVVGSVGDLVTDPLNHLTLATAPERQLALKEAQELTPLLSSRTLLAPTENLRQRVGRGIYRSGLKAADATAERFGKGENAVSNALFKRGVTGSAKSMANQAADIVENSMTKRDAVLQQMADDGVRIDLNEALTPVKARTRSIVQGAGNTPAVQQQASAYEDMLNELSKRTVTPAEASSLKTQTTQELRSNAYDQLSSTDIGQKLGKETGRAYNDAVVKSSPHGQEYAAYNKDMAPFLTSEKTMDREAIKEGMKDLFTRVDALAAPTNTAAFLLKKATDIALRPGTKTRVGKAIALDPGYTDILLRELAKPRATPKNEGQ